MKGFFTQKETGYQPQSKGKTLSCASCGLYKDVLTPKMQPFGGFSKGILCVGEAPGAVEDKRGKQWQGKTGSLLRQTLEGLGIDLFEDCLNVNAVNCRPKDNTTPTNFQVDCCRHLRLRELIEESQPQLILTFGNAALYSVIGDRWKKNLGGITKWRGWTIPDKDLRAWICPVFHPSYVMREEKNKAVETVWVNDLVNALDKLDKPLPRWRKPRIEIIDDLSLLNDINADMITIDYETTAIKPQAEGHRIICASVANTPNHAFVFMMPQDREEQQPFIRLLRRSYINKMAHNIKFEDNWSNEILNIQPRGWIWDSMLAAHMLDNRTGVTGLKFQAYVNLGVVDYSSEIAPYMRSKDEGSNSFNQLTELIKKPDGKEKLLTYCALDSIYEYRLAQIQMEQINFDFLPF